MVPNSFTVAFANARNILGLAERHMSGIAASFQVVHTLALAQFDLPLSGLKIMNKIL